MSKIVWDNRFQKSNGTHSKYDGWLDKHTELLKAFKDNMILDLGSGSGNDAEFLSGIGMNVCCLDFSLSALRCARNRKIGNLILGDIRSIPFANGTIGIAIADLSLHYFQDKKLKEIGNRIKETIQPGGYLLLRVNSINDIQFGANGEHLNVVDGMEKYYFTPDLLRMCFDMFSFEDVIEYTTDCYEKPKEVVEAKLRK